MPVLPSLDQPWNILITGVGGTGVVTIGALLGMAGHLEGKGASVLDQTGLAQKGGAVTTHIRIAHSPADIHAVRIAAGEADLVLGCDMVVVNDYWALSKIRADRSHVVLNGYQAMPGTFTRNTELQFPARDGVSVPPPPVAAGPTLTSSESTGRGSPSCRRWGSAWCPSSRRRRTCRRCSSSGRSRPSRRAGSGTWCCTA